MSSLRFAPYCTGCLPALHVPVYAAQARGAFTAAGVEIEFVGQAAHKQRVARLRSGEVDLAMLDVAALVDTVAADPTFDARCVSIVSQRLPESAFYVVGRPAGDHHVEGPASLVNATYGGTAGSRLVAAHRALLRRVGSEPTAGFVDMPYGRMFPALAAGDIDIIPDFAGVAARVHRAANPEQQVGVLRYRDCGVNAYGVGMVASADALRDPVRRDAIRRFLHVAAHAYRGMRDDPEQVIQDARGLLDVDTPYTLAEWRDEEEEVVFGYGAADAGLGASDEALWAATAAWRREVTGGEMCAPVARLHEPVAQ